MKQICLKKIFAVCLLVLAFFIPCRLEGQPNDGEAQEVPAFTEVEQTFKTLSVRGGMTAETIEIVVVRWGEVQQGTPGQQQKFTISVVDQPFFMANLKLLGGPELIFGPDENQKAILLQFDTVAADQHPEEKREEKLVIRIAPDDPSVIPQERRLVIPFESFAKSSVAACLAGTGTKEKPGYFSCEDKTPIYSTDDIWVLYRPSPGFAKTFQWRILQPDGTSFGGTHTPGLSPKEDKNRYDIRREENGEPQQMTIRMPSPDPGLYMVQMRTEFATPESTFGQGGGKDGEWQDEGTFEIVPATVFFQGFVAQKEIAFGNSADKAKLMITASSTADGIVTANLLGTWLRRECAESPNVKPEIVQEKAQSNLTISFPEAIDLGFYLSSPDADDPTPAENPEYDDAERIKVTLASPTRGRHRTGLCTLEAGNELREVVFNLEFAGLVPTAQGSPELWSYMDNAWEFSNSPAKGDFLWENPADPSQNQRPHNRSLKGPLFEGTLLYGTGSLHYEEKIGEPSRIASDHLRVGDTKWYLPVRIHMTMHGTEQKFGPYIKGYAVYGSTAGSDAGPVPPDEDLINKRKVYKIVKIEGPESTTGDKSREYSAGSLGFSYTDKLNPEGVLLSDNIGSTESFRFSQVPQVITSGEPFVIKLDAKVQNTYLPAYIKWTGKYNHRGSQLGFSMGRIYGVSAASNLPSQKINSVNLDMTFTPLPSEKINASTESYQAEISTSGNIISSGGQTNSLFIIGFVPNPPHITMDTERGNIDIYYELDEDGSLIAASVTPYRHPDMVASAPGGRTDEEGEDVPDTDEETGSVAETDADVVGEDVPGLPGTDGEARSKPIDPNTLDPNSTDVAGKIREWVLVAEPPENAIEGNNFHYSNKGNIIGTAAGGVIESRHETGAFDPVFLWKNRRQLDSINHCTLEEYVVAKLEQKSISHCAGRYGAVKDLKEMRLGKAKAAVTAAGFKYALAPGSPAKTPEAGGTIERQEPGPKQYLKKGQTLRLTVHSPYVPAGVTLPDFTRKSIKESKKWLQGKKLQVRLQAGSPAPTSKKSGTIEKQEPVPGTTIKKGSTVTLTVHSNYVDARGVPKVVGLSAGKAKASIVSAGLKAALKPGGKPSSREQAGTVKRQSPDPGTKAAASSEVSIFIYGPYVETIAVPNLVGLNLADAKRKLQNAGLELQPTLLGPAPDPGKALQVAGQRPSATTQVEAGSSVQVEVYGDYVLPGVTVPDTRGMTLRQAQNALANADLKIKPSLLGVAPDASRSQQVNSQRPAGGTTVPPGSTVQIEIWGDYVARGTSIPDVRGMTLAEAKNALQNVGLGIKPSLLGPAPNKAKALRVNSQNPHPGTTAPPGTAVKVELWGDYTPPSTERPDEVCARHYPGSVANGRTSDGRIKCDCPQGYVWNSNHPGNRTRCVRQHVPTPAEQVAALDCSRHGSSRAVEAYWDSAQQKAKCKCKSGYKPSGNTCVPTRETLVQNLDCRAYPNTYAAWSSKNNRAECFCLEGYKWTRNGGCIRESRGGRGGGSRETVCKCPRGYRPRMWGAVYGEACESISDSSKTIPCLNSGDFSN